MAIFKQSKAWESLVEAYVDCANFEAEMGEEYVELKKVLISDADKYEALFTQKEGEDLVGNVSALAVSIQNYTEKHKLWFDDLRAEGMDALNDIIIRGMRLRYQTFNGVYTRQDIDALTGMRGLAEVCGSNEMRNLFATALASIEDADSSASLITALTLDLSKVDNVVAALGALRAAAGTKRDEAQGRAMVAAMSVWPDSLVAAAKLPTVTEETTKPIFEFARALSKEPEFMRLCMRSAKAHAADITIMEGLMKKIVCMRRACATLRETHRAGAEKQSMELKTIFEFWTFLKDFIKAKEDPAKFEVEAFAQAATRLFEVGNHLVLGAEGTVGYQKLLQLWVIKGFARDAAALKSFSDSLDQFSHGCGDCKDGAASQKIWKFSLKDNSKKETIEKSWNERLSKCCGGELDRHINPCFEAQHVVA